MGYTYAVVGSGKQGTASAYDLIKFGEADKILLVDKDIKTAEESARLLHDLTGKSVCQPLEAEINDSANLKEILKGVDSVISGVPYYFNLDLTKLAIEIGANFCDFGGNTEVVKSQLDLNKEALAKNISVVPDCGMDPGINISLIQYLVDQYDKLDSVKSYGAGLMQNPEPPWNYGLTFHINGLTNEYYGNALFLREGKVIEVPSLTEYEKIEFAEPLGTLEAAVTSGGLSTLPFELEGKVKTLENKTLRYLGHWERFKGFSDLGLFEETPVKIGNNIIVPREFYHALLEPKIWVDNIKDIGIIKIFAEGIKNNRSAKTVIEILDYFDAKTGFTSMQRLTGWHASIIAYLASQNETVKGAVPVNKAVSGEIIIKEMLKRGISVNIQST